MSHRCHYIFITIRKSVQKSIVYEFFQFFYSAILACTAFHPVHCMDSAAHPRWRSDFWRQPSHTAWTPVYFRAFAMICMREERCEKIWIKNVYEHARHPVFKIVKVDVKLFRSVWRMMKQSQHGHLQSSNCPISVVRVEVVWVVVVCILEIHLRVAVVLGDNFRRWQFSEMEVVPDAEHPVSGCGTPGFWVWNTRLAVVWLAAVWVGAVL